MFLRHHRHALFDEAFQQELASLYQKAERGQPPIAPAMLALVLILEAYTGVSDDEVIEATLMDRRARYLGLCKNLFDLRRCAVVHHLHVFARSPHLQATLQDAAYYLGRHAENTCSC